MSTVQTSHMKGISRIDCKHTHGWFVRIYPGNKEVISKLFSDRKHGGREQALAEATTHRDSFPEFNLAHPPRYLKEPPSNNKTGVVGVSKTFKRSHGGKGKKIPCFCVSWRPRPKKPKTKAFYISQYPSEEEAFEAAKAFRKQKEMEIEQDEAKRTGQLFSKQQAVSSKQ